MEFAIALLVVAMIVREYFFQQERMESAKERAELAQRIQAPEVAVMAHAETPSQLTNKLPVFTDEDYAERLNGR